MEAASRVLLLGCWGFSCCFKKKRVAATLYLQTTIGAGLGITDWHPCLVFACFYFMYDIA